MSEISAPQMTVINRHSIQRADGGWDTCEIILPIGASEETIAHAITQWEATRTLILQVMRGPQQTTNNQQDASYDIDPTSAVLDFGKYRGQKLGHVVEIEPGYVEWLAVDARSEVLRSACRQILAVSAAPMLDKDIPF